MNKIDITRNDSASVDCTDVVFFFGAGAEVSFGLPSGEKYTRKTMLSKSSAMYTALRRFYQRDFSCYYYEIPKYMKEFVFQRKDSHTFCNVILDAADTIQHEIDNKKVDISRIDPDTQNFIKTIHQKRFPQKRKKEKVETLYSVLVADYSKEEKTKRYSSLVSYLSFHGAVEQDFSSLVDPNETTPNRFWRLINYFWSAYFSIVLPLLERSSRYGKIISNSKNKYSYVLDNIKEITKYLYSKEYIDELDLIQKTNDGDNGDEQKENYYSCIQRNKLAKFSVLTTNYTPFIRTIFTNTSNIAYLAGELNQFERPQWNEICSIDKCEKDFYFPFMLTQAYVKPIIAPQQLGEYKKAIEILEKGKYLVVIGYSFCKNDNHICAIIRDYLYKEKKKMIYCKYCDQGEKFDKEQCMREITEKLKIKDATVESKISIIHINSTSQVLIDNILEIIQSENEQ